MAADIKFYLDENISPEVAKQLERRGIDAVSVRGLDLLSDSDVNHLARAIEMGYVLCTQDTDYLKMAASGVEHHGIIFGTARKLGIGDWVRGLERIHTNHATDYMDNHVEYL